MLLGCSQTGAERHTQPLGKRASPNKVLGRDTDTSFSVRLLRTKGVEGKDLKPAALVSCILREAELSPMSLPTARRNYNREFPDGLGCFNIGRPSLT